MLQYPNGQAMQEGDAVRVGRGQKATVIELITDRHQIETRKLSGPGVVVETDTEGVVFLSTDLLRTEPLTYVSSGATEKTAFYGKAVLVSAAIMVPVALWSFFSAVYFAWTTGHVMVMAFDSIYEEVPWRLGWARFVGPMAMITGLVLAVDSMRRSAGWWLGIVMAGAGLLLLGFSAMFTSAHRAWWTTTFAAAFTLTVWVDRKFGRLAAFVFMLAGALALVVFAARNF